MCLPPLFPQPIQPVSEVVCLFPRSCQGSETPESSVDGRRCRIRRAPWLGREIPTEEESGRSLAVVGAGIRTGTAPRNRETVKKYLLLGKQSGEWLTRHDERLKPARAKVRNSESNSVRSTTPRAGTVLSTSRPRRRRKPC